MKFRSILYLLSFLVTPAVAGNLATIPNIFTAGNTALAKDVNENFEAARNEIDNNATDISSNSDNISSNIESITSINGQVTNINSSIGLLTGRVNALESTDSATSDSLSSITAILSLIGCNAMTRSTTFDYSNNNGIHTIGSANLQFDTKWTKAGDTSIHVYNDEANIEGVALVNDAAIVDINGVADSAIYDMSSRFRTAQENQLVVLKNVSGNYAVLKVLDVKDNTRNDLVDELTFDYCILPFGQTKFSQ